MFKQLALLCAFITIGTAPSQMRAVPASRPPQSDLKQHPTGNTTPVGVSLGLYIVDLVGIDEARESFELTGYMIAKWRDPLLAISAGASNSNAYKSRRYTMEDIWTPPIEVANSISHKESAASIEADRDGNVTAIQGFDNVLSNTFALRKFPFDTQVLRLEFEPFLSTVPEIQFASEALPRTGFRDAGHIELASWEVENVRYKIENSSGDITLPPRHNAIFEITIHRRSGFYIWKIFLPIVIMSMIPAVVFWIDPKEFDWLLKVPMTMLLSMVAFEFAIVRDLPKVGYMTFLDAIVTASFAFFFLTMIEITAAYLLQKTHLRPKVVKAHATGRWAYPAAYIAVFLLFAICFLA